jgi:hypothetical protein
VDPAAAQEVQQHRFRLVGLVVRGCHRDPIPCSGFREQNPVALAPRRLFNAHSWVHIRWVIRETARQGLQAQALRQVPRSRRIHVRSRAQAMIDVNEDRLHFQHLLHAPQGSSKHQRITPPGEANHQRGACQPPLPPGTSQQPLLYAARRLPQRNARFLLASL